MNLNMGNKPADRQFERETGPFPQHFLPVQPEHGCAYQDSRQSLLVMKFGGTSVGDAACIRKVIEIIRRGSAEGDIVVVVSAMSGVTNQLIETATRSEAGDRGRAAKILEDLRAQHDTALKALIHPGPERDRIARKIRELFEQCERWCESTAVLGQLTPQMRDSISSLGERLSAPLVAAALAAQGVASEAVDATQLVVTDGYHGAADPKMDLTRERCEARLRPLLQQGVIPIVTGFIGATEDGVLTTLGRGGSDYSATILGAVLEADEVTIWTDVDGMLTADPHLVPGASTIPEISYREAAELAYFGAKVLHPKTLYPVMQKRIPVWIRNTFAPEKAGTKITPGGHAATVGAKALTAVSDAALITLGGPALSGVPDVVGRALAAAASVRTDVLMSCHSPSCNHVCLAVAAASAQTTVEALRREFARDAKHDGAEHVTVDSTVAILTVVGHNLHLVRGIVGRAVDELSRENVNVIATAHGPMERNASFVVARKDIKTALVTTHREFQLCVLNLPQESRSEAQGL
jgi:aspartate kinase